VACHPKLEERRVADRVGFEPTVCRAYAGFQDRCLRPLDHLSADGVELIKGLLPLQ
jgi:hypothetical protein